MNSLPHLSHHLFAAAASTGALADRRRVRAEERAHTARNETTLIPLELVTPDEAGPARAARPLREAMVASR